MEKTKFVDLEIQLGLPYLYMHQGHCELMIVFTEMRVMSSEDPQNLLDYPFSQVLQSKNLFFVWCGYCILQSGSLLMTQDCLNFHTSSVINVFKHSVTTLKATGLQNSRLVNIVKGQQFSKLFLPCEWILKYRTVPLMLV